MVTLHLRELHNRDILCKGEEIYLPDISLSSPDQCLNFAVVGCLKSVITQWKVKNQPKKYVVLLPQHVSGTNKPIIRNTISNFRFRWPYLEIYTKWWALVLSCSGGACWGNKTTYLVASGWFLNFHYVYDARSNEHQICYNVLDCSLLHI
jgi:hypothetical protein